LAITNPRCSAVSLR